MMNDSMMDSMTSSSSSLLDLADYLGGNPEFCDAVRQRARHLDGTVHPIIPRSRDRPIAEENISIPMKPKSPFNSDILLSILFLDYLVV